MSIAGGVVHKTTTRKIRSTQSKYTIDLVKVFDPSSQVGKRVRNYSDCMRI